MYSHNSAIKWSWTFQNSIAIAYWGFWYYLRNAAPFMGRTEKKCELISKHDFITFSFVNQTLHSNK